ncbi:hypothetical protein HDU86_007105 [Geranomyces michiganensis]|nr:hypothetical protein HDU86_007105 [Geranomyces michiganensis]
MTAEPFARFQLPQQHSGNIFDTLSAANEFESFPSSSEGAVMWRGAILVRSNTTKNEAGRTPIPNLIPIVRTTTRYSKPSQPFSTVHHNLVETIRSVANLPEHDDLNNAMVEIYEPAYKTMKWHSDQALDLAPDSHICIFSCYEDAKEEPAAQRRLIYKKKGEGSSETVLRMDHNSVIVFSTEANGAYVHKIVAGTKPPKSRWLGVTLRQSKTFIMYDDQGVGFFAKGKGELCVLRMATEEERSEFYRHKSQENKVPHYVYPELPYTLSMH